MRKHSMQNILVFLIFSMFAILSLILIVVGIKFYDNIADKSEDNTQLRNSCVYIENKIRSNDKVGGIEVVDVDGTNVLLLTSENGTEYRTAIYQKDGYIMECLLNPANGINTDFGDKIAKADGMTISRDGDVINISITYKNETQNIREKLQTGVI